jgi:hypothetical protein
MKRSEADDPPQRIQPPGADDDAAAGALSILHAASAALRSGVGRDGHDRIPLEQLERELARVMHIELAALLVRARQLQHRQPHRSESVRVDPVEPEILAEDVGLAFAADDDSLSAEHCDKRRLRALQSDVRESIDVARACGVRVPRVVARLLAIDPATWPAAERLTRWALLLDPAVASRTCAREALER